MLKRTLFCCLLLTGTAAFGAGEPDAAPESATLPVVEPVPDREPETAPPPAASNPRASQDTFVPSEEISEDLSVSFPIDI